MTILIPPKRARASSACQQPARSMNISNPHLTNAPNTGKISPRARAHITRGDVAQLGEHHVRNVGVVGSNPIISTTESQGLRFSGGLSFCHGTSACARRAMSRCAPFTRVSWALAYSIFAPACQVLLRRAFARGFICVIVCVPGLFTSALMRVRSAPANPGAFVGAPLRPKKKTVD